VTHRSETQQLQNQWKDKQRAQGNQQQS